jgi:1-acyl-sn-glycerol-3-phosphate acyltransferase
LNDVFQKLTFETFSDCSHALQYIAKSMGLKFTIKGKENLAKQRSAVVVANHQTSVDALGELKSNS